MASKTKPEVAHALDPLSADEIRRAKEIVEDAKNLDDKTRYTNITLDEPTKDELVEDGSDGAERRVLVVIRDCTAKESVEAIVSLDEEDILSWDHIEDGQPSINLREFEMCEATVKADDRWREAVRKRGVENFDLAMVDPWSAGYHLLPDDMDKSRRLAHGMTWVRTSEDDNGYARPLDGIHVYVDLDDMEVVKVVDNGVKFDNITEDLDPAPYREEHRDLREDLKPYNVDQPDGPSWEIDGRKIEWQNWHVRVGWTQREGLVLHDIGYEDDGETRKIMDRASCVEMAVPYGDRDPNHNWKNAFDVGEYNIGQLANSLTEGCDCLGYMHYFDAEMNDVDGNPVILENAICVHEEDYGTLWTHTDWRTENTEMRRNRRLVISFVSTVGNYDYEFNWYFYQDGSIEGQVRLTGIDSNGLVGPDEDASGYAELLAPNLKGMIHQHFFNFRLDLDIDGQENNLYRVENAALPTGPSGAENNWPGEDSEINPAGQAFYAEKTQHEDEQSAQDLIDSLSGRYWQIENPNQTNKLGEPRGYKLVPGENVKAGAQKGSSVMERATFIDNHLWATPYDPDERFPAGEYPNQNDGESEGLPAWTEQNRSLEEEDIVLWYTLGVNHVTRPEDWPILPVHISSFKLEPVHFFDESPAIDVPPEHAIKDIQARRTQKYADPTSVARSDEETSKSDD
jgi:primary-amine oxidase